MKIKNILGKSGSKVSNQSIQTNFVSLASHQLRTPLSAIKWYLEILLSLRTGKLNKKQTQYLKEIYRSADRATNLVNDLLDVSRIQEGEIHLDLRPIKIDKVVEEIIDNFSTLIRSSQVNINFEIINGPLPEVEADQDKLKRVIVNLLSNSIKYTPAGGKIRIAVEKKKNFIRVSVEDSGVGIPQEEQMRIFQKFFRSANVIKLAPVGTGLGLFIARSLVEAMGGKMGFASREGIGTTFYFTLPLKV